MDKQSKNIRTIKNQIKKEQPKKNNYKWTLTVIMLTFLISVLMSLATENIISKVDILIGTFLLIVVIFIGIIFDIIGIAVTSADEKLFHSMAANKVKEGKVAIKLIKNADKVSNFCNDVVGDICGIISGALGATLAVKIISTFGIKNGSLLSIVFTALIASSTVGGKAMGKSIAIKQYKEIINFISKILIKFKRVD